MTNDLTAIRAQMEALAGHTMGPWHLCAHLANDDENGCSCGYRGVIYGPQREGYAVCQPGHEPAPEGQEGTEPPRYERSQEVRNARLIAVAPDMRETIITLCDEIERLRRMLDLRGTGPAERYWEGRWRDEAAENERLRKALKGMDLEAQRETVEALLKPTLIHLVMKMSDDARAALAQNGGE